MELRVEDLAAECSVTVDTVRFYQGRRLLPPPRRVGRIAWYGDEHVERLSRIRALQASGFTLTTIARILNGELDAADAALVGEVLAADVPHEGPAPADDDERLTIGQLASAIGVPVELLHALEAEDLLIPRRHGGDHVYTHEDVAAARAGLTLLEHGVPLTDLMDLARSHRAVTDEIAERAVGLFSTHVRAQAAGDPDALVRAFGEMFTAVSTLVSYHFARRLLRAALEHVDAPDDGERAAG